MAGIFLTGSQESITALTKAVGFGYDFDPKSGQFAHSTAIMMLTPQGKIAQYYYGVEFPPRDLRLGLIQASQNKIGTLADEVLLYCYHYDPATGKYGAVISHILQLAGGATILSIGTVLLVLFRRGSDSEHKGRRQLSTMFDNFPLWPASASTHALRVDLLYIFLVVISAAMTLAIFATIAVFRSQVPPPARRRSSPDPRLAVAGDRVVGAPDGPLHPDFWLGRGHLTSMPARLPRTPARST